METEKKRKTYDRQFKIDAVNLVVNGGRTVEEAARELGISRELTAPVETSTDEQGVRGIPGKRKT